MIPPKETGTIVSILDNNDQKIIQDAVNKVIEIMNPLTPQQKITIFCVLLSSLERMAGLNFTATFAMHKYVEAHQYGKSPTKQQILSNPNLTQEGKDFLLNMIADGR